MQALFWELSRQGVTTNPEEFDIRRFDEEMRKIFGDGANVFIEEICSQLTKKVQQDYGQHATEIITDDQSLTPVERIQKILSLKVIS